MNKKTVLTVFISLMTLFCFAQEQLPIGTCGIVNVYDAVGNRTKRVYFCNNGIDPYPQNVKPPADSEAEISTTKENETSVFQYVDALYPNPTTGKFFVTFSKNLSNSTISILDNNGKTLARFKASGFKLDFDLSPYAAGMYYVRIEENGKAITKKVVKQ